MTEAEAGTEAGTEAPSPLSLPPLPVPDPLPDRVPRIGMVARWKPVHRGHAAVLEALCDRADLALIGIGSANRSDPQNPFTPAETAAMIRAVLAGRDNFRLLEIDDLGHGPRWSALVRERFGALDLFATANGYVRALLAPFYPVVHPARLVPRERHVRVDGTMVREAMARGEPWRHLVPPVVARYLDEHGLVERFLREHGAALREREVGGG